MGCASSKRVESSVVADVYRPPPTSIAVFDINTIEEPWLITTTTVGVTAQQEKAQEQQQSEIKKPMQVSLPILEKLETDGNDLAPQLSWSEVSKALEDLKPSLEQEAKAKPVAKKEGPPLKSPQKPASFVPGGVRDAEAAPPPPELTGRRPVKENSFIIRDRQERDKNSADASKVKWRRPAPLEGYPELCPPGNPDGVVLYTTSLRGVRRTFEDCEWARRVVYPNALDTGVDVDERDVSLHGEFLKEVRELAGEGAAVPRLFVMGRYIGGIEVMVEANESGKMRDMMRWVARKVGRGAGEAGKGGWVGCDGCGGARFIPCLECSGSCKVVGEDGKEVVRCGKCNENGLVMCPLCHQGMRSE